MNIDFASRDQTKLKKRYKAREKKKNSNITTKFLKNSFIVEKNVKINNNFCIFWTVKSTLGKIDKIQFFFSFTSNNLPTESVTEEKNQILRSKLEICQIVVSILFLEMFAFSKFWDSNRWSKTDVCPVKSLHRTRI